MGQFLDGGLIANNPTLDVLTDIHKYNSNVRGDQACPFGLVVSLGTGVPPPMRVASFDVFKPESIWDATNVLLGARALGELLVDQVCTSRPYLRHPPSCARFRTDVTKAMSRGISGANKRQNLPIRLIVAEFVYYLKTRQQFNSHAPTSQKFA